VAGDKPKLRKREILLAVAAGVLATGTAAIIMEDGFDVVEYSEPSVISASGATEMAYELADFTEIRTEGPQDIVVTYGEEFSVRSEGSSSALGLLQARVSDGRLTIGPADGFNMGNWQRLRDATFYVTMPALEAVTISGYGDMRIDGVSGDSFSAAITGSESTLDIVNMDVDEANIVIAGSGKITLAGEAREASLVIGGSGEIEAAQLRSETADIRIGGIGNVSLSVSDDAEIAIGGSGDVAIYGNATCSVSQFGGGDVECGLPALPDLAVAGEDESADNAAVETEATVEEEAD
jgi:hypothetical protein